MAGKKDKAGAGRGVTTGTGGYVMQGEEREARAAGFNKTMEQALAPLGSADARKAKVEVLGAVLDAVNGGKISRSDGNWLVTRGSHEDRVAALRKISNAA